MVQCGAAEHEGRTEGCCVSTHKLCCCVLGFGVEWVLTVSHAGRAGLEHTQLSFRLFPCLLSAAVCSARLTAARQALSAEFPMPNLL